MAIIVKDNLFTLQTQNSTYQMKVDCHGVLLHTYYGKQIDPRIWKSWYSKRIPAFPEIPRRPWATVPIRWIFCRRSFLPAA